MLLNNVLKSNSAELPFLLLPQWHMNGGNTKYSPISASVKLSMIKKKVSLNLIAVYQYFNKQ